MLSRSPASSVDLARARPFTGPLRQSETLGELLSALPRHLGPRSHCCDWGFVLRRCPADIPKRARYPNTCRAPQQLELLGAMKEEDVLND